MSMCDPSGGNSFTFDFFYAQHTCSLASHIALEESGAVYRIHRLNLDSRDHHSQQYLSLNPKARVPTLITPEGVLTETPAILFYLAQIAPASCLAPIADTYSFSRIQEFNSFIASTLHVAHAHRMRGHRWVDDELAIVAMQKKVAENMTAAYTYIEHNFLQTDYVVGDQFSIADAYLFTFAQWLEDDGVDPAVFPKIIAHRQKIGSRDSVMKALKAQFE